MWSWLIGVSPPRTCSHDRHVARDQPLDGSAHAVFREPTHLEQPSFELLEFILKMRYDALWH